VRTLLASSLAVGAVVMFACGGDYGSDDPAANPDGGASSSSGGSNGDGGPGGTTDGGGTPGKPITVTGKIVSFGVGLANVPVVVGGKTPVNTSTLGTFTVPDVQPPYDVEFALKTSDSQPRVTIYQGLTRPDPTLVALGTNGELRPNPTTATSLSGTVSGANGPGWARVPIVSFSAPNRAYGFAAVDQSSGKYTMQGNDGPMWYGANAVTGSLSASLVLDNAMPVTAYYGRVDGVTVTGGMATSDKNIALAQVQTAVVQAKITAPQRYTDASKTVVNMGIRYPEGAGYFVKSTNQAFPLDLKRPVPFVNGGSFQASVGYALGGDAEASFARATALATMSGELSLALADPPAQTAPDDGARAASNTFTFSAFPGGIHRFTIAAANQPSVTIVTAATSVTLPDLTPFAITLPGNVEYSWRVAGFRPIPSIDADGLAILLAAIDGNLPNVDQCEIAISPARRVILPP
jgi:hypothetical protein